MWFNNIKVLLDEVIVSMVDIVDGRLLLFVVGKKNKLLILVIWCESICVCEYFIMWFIVVLCLYW